MDQARPANDQPSKSAITDELILKLKDAAQGAELNHLQVDLEDDLYEIVAKTPRPGDYKRWRMQRGSDDMAERGGTNALLVASCIVWPARDQWGAMATRKPGLV